MPKKKERDLTIYPIKMSDDKLNQGNAEEKYPLNNPVHLHLIVGRVKSGKSLLMNNLYLSRRFFGEDYKTKILISSTAYNDAVNKYIGEGGGEVGATLRSTVSEEGEALTQNKAPFIRLFVG